MTVYAVIRNCCTSGNCDTCRRVTPFGKPMEVEHARYPRKDTAVRVAAGWSSYGARVEIVEGPPATNEMRQRMERMREQVRKFRTETANQLEAMCDEEDLPEVTLGMTVAQLIDWLRTAEVR